MATFIILEDERIIAEDLCITLEEFDHEVLDIAVEAKEGLEKIKKLHPDIVVIDIMLEGEIDGIEVASIVKNKYHLPIIFFTAFTDELTRKRAMSLDPVAFIVKPYKDFELKQVIDSILDQK